ncbi:MAG: hypothetical protein FWG71_10350 [Synergistaceae bacterium]|nr:hypothetical protein [Synergistaceae bacterium]
MVKIKRAVCVMLPLLLMGLAAGADARPALDQRRLSVVLFPTENHTDIQVWESKYYPYSVLEQRMTEYLASLFNDSAMVDVTILDETGMNRWLDSSYRPDDMAVQLELYGAVLKEREVLGKVETGSVKLRVKIFDASEDDPFATRVAAGKDRRYTFDPGDDRLFWIDQKVISLPFGGMDVLGLTKVPYKGQQMSRPTWQQFAGTSHWQAIKNGIKDAYRESMAHVSIALKRNDPEMYDAGAPPFNPFPINVGRIISPTADSTRRNRKYVISMGREDALQVGDVLEVVRSDTYVSVDPENPVAVIPASIGKVRVTDLQERTAVVRVIRDNRKEPIQLTDLVMKFHRPEMLEMKWESKTP